MSASGEARALPHNLEVERAVLGAMLVNAQAIELVLALLTAEDFYRATHRWLFAAMARLHARHVAIDLVTVCEELAPRELEEIRQSYITGLVDGMPHSSNAEDYARIVRELADRRRVVLTARKLEALVFEDDRSTTDILDGAQQELLALTERQAERGFVSIDAVLRNDTMPILERAFASKTGITGISTGFTDLDQFTRGFQPCDLYLIGARTSTGKTSVATEMMRHIAVHCGLPVGIFSLEMSQGAIGCRFLIAQARVDGHRLMGGLILGDEWPRVSAAMNTLGGAPIYIDDTSTISVAEMRTRARRLRAEHGLKLLFIDYVQLMNGTGRAETRNLELAAISRGVERACEGTRSPNRRALAVEPRDRSSTRWAATDCRSPRLRCA